MSDPIFKAIQIFEHHKAAMATDDSDVATANACAAWDLVEVMRPTTRPGWEAKFHALANEDTFPVEHKTAFYRLSAELDAIDDAGEDELDASA